MRFQVILLLALLAVSPAASAAKVKSGAPACLTSLMLDIYVGAIAHKDEGGKGYAHEQGCVDLGKDVTADILETQSDDIQVKITAGDGAGLVVWVPASYVTK